MKCAECDTEIEQSDTTLVQDYLCPRCRIALDPEVWDERDRVVSAVQEWLRSRGEFYYGYQILFPKDSPWAWVKIYDDADLVDNITQTSLHNVGAYDKYLISLSIQWYHVWKHTGYVYEAEPDGAIHDDPIFIPSFA